MKEKTEELKLELKYSIDLVNFLNDNKILWMQNWANNSPNIVDKDKRTIFIKIDTPEDIFQLGVDFSNYISSLQVKKNY